MSQVFVVDRAAFFGGAWPQGFVPLAAAEAASFLAQAEARGRFEPRAIAEETPAWKQWIPYCVVRCVVPGTDNPLPTGVFRVRRSSGQSEARLHGKWSIGLGGHIEPIDTAAAGAGASGSGSTVEEFFPRALWRELYEELHLSLPDGHALRFLGLLNDDATAVGAVHAGLVYALDLEVPLEVGQEAVSVREISKMSGCLGSLAEFANLWQDPSQFETWSQFLIRAGVLGPMACSDVSSARAGGLESGSGD